MAVTLRKAKLGGWCQGSEERQGVYRGQKEGRAQEEITWRGQCRPDQEDSAQSLPVGKDAGPFSE
eukprot:10676354-Heterocapsa_arctica.AAC.1